MFLRAENRSGGPADPVHGFEESLNLLFPGAYKEPSLHPMHKYISTYSFGKTPKLHMTEEKEAEKKDGENPEPPKKVKYKVTFQDISSEV